MKQTILLLLILSALALSACVYENPNPSDPSTTETEARVETGDETTVGTRPADSDTPADSASSAVTDPTVPSEFPNDTDDDYSKRY